MPLARRTRKRLTSENSNKSCILCNASKASTCINTKTTNGKKADSYKEVIQKCFKITFPASADDKICYKCICHIKNVNMFRKKVEDARSRIMKDYNIPDSELTSKELKVVLQNNFGDLEVENNGMIIGDVTIKKVKQPEQCGDFESDNNIFIIDLDELSAAEDEGEVHKPNESSFIRPLTEQARKKILESLHLKKNDSKENNEEVNIWNLKDVTIRKRSTNCDRKKIVKIGSLVKFNEDDSKKIISNDSDGIDKNKVTEEVESEIEKYPLLRNAIENNKVSKKVELESERFWPLIDRGYMECSTNYDRKEFVKIGSLLKFNEDDSKKIISNDNDGIDKNKVTEEVESEIEKYPLLRNAIENNKVSKKVELESERFWLPVDRGYMECSTNYDRKEFVKIGSFLKFNEDDLKKILSNDSNGIGKNIMMKGRKSKNKKYPLFGNNTMEKNKATKGAETKNVKYPPLDKNCTECPVCGQKYQLHKQLWLHYKRHFSKYLCYQCGKTCKSTSELGTHMKSHGTTMQQCPMCPKQYISIYVLKNHIKRHHNKVKMYSCSLCNIRFNYLVTRRKHNFEVHGVETYNFRCTDCGKLFFRAPDLQRHVKLVHSDQREYVCMLCERGFFTSRTLQDHMVTHTGIKDFHCERCGKSFSRLSSLKEHLKIHLDIKEHQCHVCDREFVQKIGLKMHLKTHGIAI